MKYLTGFCLCLLVVGPLAARNLNGRDGGRISDDCMNQLRLLTVERNVVGDVEKSNGEKIDAKEAAQLWAGGDEESDFAKSYLQKTSCKVMHDCLSKTFELMDCFTLDSKGKIVAMLFPTPNFIHDREPCFTCCYNNGQGQLFVEEPEPIRHSKAHLVKVSLPIQEGEKTIGVLVATVLLAR